MTQAKINVDLTVKTKPVFFKIFCIVIGFIAVFSLIFLLYGLLWKKYSMMFAKTMTRGFVISTTETACTIDADCGIACDMLAKSPSDSCLCLKGFCHFVSSSNQFSSNKFCEQDSDCTLSCYEGPVSKEYYERMGGQKNDCADGCKEVTKAVAGTVSQVMVCRNYQCQHQDGRTCFIEPMRNPL